MKPRTFESGKVWTSAGWVAKKPVTVDEPTLPGIKLHGGKRPGAGRKASGSATVRIWTDDVTQALFDSLCERASVSPGEMFAYVVTRCYCRLDDETAVRKSRGLM